MICCVTGHRPLKFPFDYTDKNSRAFLAYQNRLVREVEFLIDEGYRHFISEMAQGVDLDFAETVIALRNKMEHNPSIFLELAIPCASQTRNWNACYLDQYSYVLANSDWQTQVSTSYDRGCMQRRNQYMVDQSDLILAVWNGEPSGGTWNTIQYAKRMKKTVRIVSLNDLCV